MSFLYNKEYELLRITVHENPAYTIDEAAFNNKEQKDSWGLKGFFEEGGDSYYQSNRIQSWWLKNKLSFGVLRVYSKVLLTSKDAFDLLMPLLLNLILFVTWLVGQNLPQ
ncbi:hypothetical protein ACFFUS_00070 [Vibrio gallaecicus]|uniref:hypothetical protein n=1 Tax=Vibrio gallaecicus TaxID=552386 RepID=UPI0010C970B4|nr:hypothetical protein [Vibrio gallaecicus]